MKFGHRFNAGWHRLPIQPVRLQCVKRLLAAELPRQAPTVQATAIEVAMQVEERSLPRAALNLDNRRTMLSRFMIEQRLRQVFDGRSGKERRQRQRLAKRLLDAIHHVHGKQRMAAEIEEAVADADWPDTKQLLPYLRELMFKRIARLDISAAHVLARGIRHRQHFAVYLTIGTERHRFEHDESRRHHVMRQLAFEEAPQRGGHRGLI